MIFRGKEKEKFLRDEKYYRSTESYCLGRTLEDAAEIIRKIEEEINVGMDNRRDEGLLQDTEDTGV